MQQNKTVAKFEIQDMLPIALTIVVVGIGIVYGIDVIADVRDDFTAGTDEYAAANNTLLGVSKFPEKLPMITTVIIAAIVIGILVRYMMVRSG